MEALSFAKPTFTPRYQPAKRYDERKEDNGGEGLALSQRSGGCALLRVPKVPKRNKVHTQASRNEVDEYVRGLPQSEERRVPSEQGE